MMIYFEETIKRYCQIQADLAELLEFDSVEDYINWKKLSRYGVDIYRSEYSKPGNIERSRLTDFDSAILGECESENNRTLEEVMGEGIEAI